MIYFYENNQKKGPFSPDHVRDLVAAGRIRPETLLEDDQGRHLSASLLPGLFPSPAAAKPPVMPPTCANPVPIAVSDSEKPSRASTVLKGLVTVGEITRRFLGIARRVIAESRRAKWGKDHQRIFCLVGDRRQGPYNKSQLKSLAVQGLITPQTVCEIDGDQILCGAIPGLRFSSNSSSDSSRLRSKAANVSAPAAPQVVVNVNQSANQSSGVCHISGRRRTQTSGCVGCLLVLLFVFFACVALSTCSEKPKRPNVRVAPASVPASVPVIPAAATVESVVAEQPNAAAVPDVAGDTPSENSPEEDLTPSSEKPLSDEIVPVDPKTAQKITDLKIRARRLLKELLDFKDDPKFHDYGFGAGGPFGGWLDRVEKLNRDAKKLDRKYVGPTGTYFPFAVAVADLRQIGQEFRRSKGESTEFTDQTLPEIREALKPNEKNVESQ